MNEDERRAHLDLTARVGRELAALGLAKHVEALRLYYADVRACREPRTWSAEMVLQWARDLRIPPHEHDIPVKPRQSSCGCSSPKTYTSAVWPGGSRHMCSDCGASWIEVG